MKQKTILSTPLMSNDKSSIISYKCFRVILLFMVSLAFWGIFFTFLVLYPNLFCTLLIQFYYYIFFWGIPSYINFLHPKTILQITFTLKSRPNSWGINPAFHILYPNHSLHRIKAVSSKPILQHPVNHSQHKAAENSI